MFAVRVGDPQPLQQLDGPGAGCPSRQAAVVDEQRLGAWSTTRIDGCSEVIGSL